MLMQTPLADTTSYMIFGFAVIFGTMLIYLVTLIARSRNLKNELETLEELDKN